MKLGNLIVIDYRWLIVNYPISIVC